MLHKALVGLKRENACDNGLHDYTVSPPVPALFTVTGWGIGGALAIRESGVHLPSGRKAVIHSSVKNKGK